MFMHSWKEPWLQIIKYRGLDGYKEGSWLYKNKFAEKNGLCRRRREIFYNKELIYIFIKYHGGKIAEHKSLKEFSKILIELKISGIKMDSKSIIKELQKYHSQKNIDGMKRFSIAERTWLEALEFLH